MVITFRRLRPLTSRLSPPPRLLLDLIEDAFRIRNEVPVSPLPLPCSGEVQAGRRQQGAPSGRGEGVRTVTSRSLFIFFF